MTRNAIFGVTLRFVLIYFCILQRLSVAQLDKIHEGTRDSNMNSGYSEMEKRRGTSQTRLCHRREDIQWNLSSQTECGMLISLWLTVLTGFHISPDPPLTTPLLGSSSAESGLWSEGCTTI